MDGALDVPGQLAGEVMLVDGGGMAVELVLETFDSKGDSLGCELAEEASSDVCVPDCTGKECGDNGCGGSCGSCAASQICHGEAGACSTVPYGMVFVPSGSFWMGCNVAVDQECLFYEFPYHEVYLDAYYVDKLETTAGDFQECASDGDCVAISDEDCWAGQWGTNFGKSGRAHHPINCVTWGQAEAFCEWAKKRLCTEAEWERAARGSDGRKYPWGNEVATCDFAVFKESVSGCGTGGTWAVGSEPKGVSPYGTLDMAGNVWEWTADRFGEDYYSASPAANPTGPASGKMRVYRGGSFRTPAEFLRVSTRLVALPSGILSFDDVGIRCCKSISAEM